MAGPMPGGLSLDDFLRDVEPEGMPVKIGLILSGVVLVYSAILVYGIHAGANNALTQWLTSVVRQFFSQ
jgi:hypothetical protein